MTIIDITLAAEGRGLYTAYLNDRLVVEKSKTPIFAAARVLMDQGHDDEAILVARHAGSTSIAMRGRLGILAGFTVHEGDHDGLRIAKYRTLYEDMPFSPVRYEQGQANTSLLAPP